MTNESQTTGESQAADQPEIDESWLKLVHPGLQAVARRYGRTLFDLTIHVAQAGADIQSMAAMIKSRDAQQRLLRLATAMNKIGLLALTSSGLTAELLAECKKDIDLALQLMGEEVKAQTPSGIILPH